MKDSREAIAGLCKELGLDAMLDGSHPMAAYLDNLEKIILFLLSREAQRSASKEEVQ